jgi:hypothetical protein
MQPRVLYIGDPTYLPRSFLVPFGEGVLLSGEVLLGLGGAITLPYAVSVTSA